MHDAVTVGGAAYDLFINTDRKSTEFLKARHPGEKTEHIAYPTGAKVLIESAVFDVGGGATNTATCLSRLGLKTGSIFNVGNDLYGEKILECMRKEKVEFLGKVTNEKTDFSIILDSKGHDRTILAYKGASCSLKLNQIKKEPARWLYISTLTGDSYETAVRLAAGYRKKGTKIAFNPSTYLAKKGHKHLGRLIHNIDMLVLNKEEAMLLTEEKGIPRMLHTLEGWGPDTTIITDGAKGAYACCGGTVYKAHPHRNARIVEATGAGDAFASSAVAGMITKEDLMFALQLGICNAESVISHFGAHNKLLTWKEAIRSIRQNPAKITKIKG